MSISLFTCIQTGIKWHQKNSNSQMSILFSKPDLMQPECPTSELPMKISNPKTNMFRMDFFPFPFVFGSTENQSLHLLLFIISLHHKNENWIKWSNQGSALLNALQVIFPYIMLQVRTAVWNITTTSSRKQVFARRRFSDSFFFTLALDELSYHLLPDHNTVSDA